jgi:glycosyltransferase involved in cell wall biosynthesis
MKAAVCTIVAKNYLAHARVLMESVRLWNPELFRIVILVDRIDGYFDPGKEPFDIVLSEELDIPKARWFHFKYPILELSTAVKPYALDLLLDRYELDKIIYLDPDIKVYASLKPLLDMLDEYSMVLTPHLTDPLDDGFHPSELDILRCGTFNLGFIALSAGLETHRFLEWWRKKLYDLCVVDLPRGIFVDQRWMDLAPSLFSGVGIIREPGYNVAYWNLNARHIERFQDLLRVNGKPLYFLHFSGFDPRNPGEVSRHQNRFRFSTLGAVTQELALQYRDDLFSAGFNTCRRWPYAYGRFVNGLPIHDRCRSLHHESRRIGGHLEDPFSEEGFRKFVTTCNEPIVDPPENKKSRDPIWIKAEAENPEKLNELIAGNGGLKLTRLAQIIYESRPELQRSFPDPCGRDGVKFLTWILTYGRKEHLLTEPYLGPLRSQWNGVLVSLDSNSARLWHRFLFLGMSTSVTVRSMVDTVSSTLGRMKSNIALRPPRGGLAQPPGSRIRRLRKLDSGPASAAEHKAAAVPVSFGLNIVGYVRAEMGVGESARAASRAARAIGIPIAVKEIACGEYRSEDQSVGPTTEKLPYAINVFHVNADQTQAVFGSPDHACESGKYNIGFWHWELERFPERWMRAFDPYKEIWTSSTFCQQSIARVSPIPVVHIPHAISFEPPPTMGRAYFGLPSGRFLFLTLFDMLSVFDRKNPLGAAEAFIRAFGNDSSVQLIIKINNAKSRPDHLKTLQERIAGYPITIIDATFTRNETYGLMNVCDCLISLHRSEGFGLTLAEAMFLGKPVIATAYSGNMDFTRFDNSFLVGYRLKPVGKHNEPYDEDALWADPSVEQAAQQMRTVTGSPQICQQLAVAGQEFVRRRLSPEAVGRQMAGRLNTIQSQVGRRS